MLVFGQRAGDRALTRQGLLGLRDEEGRKKGKTQRKEMATEVGGSRRQGTRQGLLDLRGKEERKKGKTPRKERAA